MIIILILTIGNYTLGPLRKSSLVYFQEMYRKKRSVKSGFQREREGQNLGPASNGTYKTAVQQTEQLQETNTNHLSSFLL